MAEKTTTGREKESVATPPQKSGEPGLFDTIGSFPVWMLKIIDAVTPDCLRSGKSGDSPKP